MSGFCSLCYKDPGTGALLCVRLGKWVEMCPSFPRRLSVEGIKGEEKGNENINTDRDRRWPVEHPHAVAVRVAKGMHRL